MVKEAYGNLLWYGIKSKDGGLNFFERVDAMAYLALHFFCLRQISPKKIIAQWVIPFYRVQMLLLQG
ncbi:MAG: hypothetical protein WBB27_06520 [Maribacter sp.]